MTEILIYLSVLLLAAISAPLIVKGSCRKSSFLFALISAAGFALLMHFTTLTAGGERLVYQAEWLPALYLNFSFLLDGLSLFMGLLVTGMGTLVLIFAGKYMEVYSHKERFFLYLLLFEFAMLGLVLSGNLFTLFIFWELTSVTSFLLVGFSHEKAEARQAALQALLITVMGGLAMMAGFILLGQTAGTLEIHELLLQGEKIRESPNYLPALLLILAGAFTKSAQFPFHFWLPGAMQAPSPVSAFLHSATMVKAGIYLLARLYPVLAGTPEWRYILTSVGMITMLLGAYFAYAQTDFKKLLAYTTISALGTLVMLLGLDTHESITAAVVFLLVHALYKGALFMTAGLIDKAAHTRDLGKLGGLYRIMPFTAIVAILSLMSMAGLPPTVGFIGKELIYEAKVSIPQTGTLLTIAGVITNIFMVAISLALIFRLFLGKEKFPSQKPAPPSLQLKAGPIVLAVVSLVIGIFPGYFAGLLLQPAITSIYPEISRVKLSLWHGFNQVLVISILTVVSGILLFRLHHILNPRLVRFGKWIVRVRFSELFNKGLEGFHKATLKKTTLIQSGYMRLYIMIILVTTTILVWAQIWHLPVYRFPLITEISSGYEVILPVIMTISVVFAVLSRSRLAAITALGVVGYGVALIYVIYGATDLAITQMLTETLLMVVFVSVVYHMPRMTQYSGRKARIRDAFIALAGGSFITGLILTVYGSSPDTTLRTFFAENSLSQAQGKNIVNVILVDFRALDTLGEITVVAVAAVGVFAMLKLKPKGGNP